MFTVIIVPRARRQVITAAQWWRAHRAAALTLLDDELHRGLVQLAHHPNAGAPLQHRGRLVRRLVLSRTGYALIYRVLPRARRVEVLAFWHASRGTSPP
mgnify:CR=1 FL=1